MAASGNHTGTPRTKPRVLSQLVQTWPRHLGAVAGLCVISLALSVTDASAIKIKKKPKVKKTPTVQPIDLDRCDVTDQMTVDWIATNPLTAALSKAYADIDADWNQLGEDKFGHPNSTNVSGTKSEARALLNRHKSELWIMSQKIAGKLIPACDSCQSMDNWGRLTFIASKLRNRKKIGNFTAADLTRAQVDNNEVNVDAEAWIALRELRASAPDYPLNARSKLRSDLDDQCDKELEKDLSVVRPEKCNTTKLGEYLNVYEDSLIENLKKSFNADRNSPKARTLSSSKLKCRPSSNFDYLSEVR